MNSQLGFYADRVDGGADDHRRGRVDDAEQWVFDGPDGEDRIAEL